jgi:hypothetical protein
MKLLLLIIGLVFSSCKLSNLVIPNFPAVERDAVSTDKDLKDLTDNGKTFPTTYRVSDYIEKQISSPTGDCDKLKAITKSSLQCIGDYKDKKVLYIGDSHSVLYSKTGTTMGNKISDKLKKCGASEVHYRGVCGSRPKSWMPGKTPKTTCGLSSMGPSTYKTTKKGETKNLSDLQKEVKPEVIVINLGDNMFTWKKVNGKNEGTIPSSTKVISEVQALLKTIPSQVNCVWIGPVYHSKGRHYHKPNKAVDKLYDAIIKGVGSRCQLVDSRGVFSSTKANDGLHLLPSESKVWGENIAKKL